MAILRNWALGALLVLSLPLMLRAQTPNQAGMFPFVIPWDDASSGTATNVSFLNPKPAGAGGFIVVKDGHFVESDTGKRIRFLGVSMAAHDAFPDHADAALVAARLAKYGINLVRLHHMDNDNWGQDAHIWDDAYDDYRHIDAAQLDKLDYFVYQLKKNGIYVDLNLHVSRQFTPADGFPASVSQIPFDFDKRVDNFDPRMIALQKEYAKQLLAHVNPYTHLFYADDPCVAEVEINNENSLVGDPWTKMGAGLDALPQPFLGELVGLWNQWLQAKYGSEAALQAAWLKGVTPVGPKMLNAASAWSIEHQGTSQATDTVSAPVGDSAPEIQVNIAQVDGTVWHVQAHVTGINFQNGTTYTVSFRAKADAPRALPVAAALDEADWHNIGLDASANLTTDWQTFQYTFTAQGAVPDHARIAFTLGGQTGTVWIADLQCRPGAIGAGVQPGQSLAAKNIGIPVSATAPQWADWMTFLADTEQNYANEMRDYLKNTLHVHANLIDSQISWGGLSGIYREAKMEYADNHAYWQHPSFPGTPWDAVNWNIPDTPMVADLAGGGGGTFLGLAENRIAGKPYSVSEYNEPAPNDYQAETVPEIATFAAFQNWDSVILFDYGSYGTGGDNDQIDGYFGVGSNPAKWAFMPAAALIFRDFEFPAAVNSATVDLPRVYSPKNVDAPSVWSSLGKGVSPAFLTQKMALSPVRSSAVPVLKFMHSHMPSPSTLTVKTTSSGPVYLAESAGSLAIVGFVGGQTIVTPEGSFQFPAFGDNFAAITLTPLDGKPIASSQDMLLTLVGKVENTGMVWNAAHNSVNNNWGHGPTLAEGIPATITLTRSQPITSVSALDDTGDTAAPVALSQTQFTVGPQDKTLWYEIKR